MPTARIRSARVILENGNEQRRILMDGSFTETDRLGRGGKSVSIRVELWADNIDPSSPAATWDKTGAGDALLVLTVSESNERFNEIRDTILAIATTPLRAVDVDFTFGFGPVDEIPVFSGREPVAEVVFSLGFEQSNLF